MGSVSVIGAGAVGLASAYYLRKEGHDVTVFDPAPLAAKASGHNAGWLIPSMSTPVPAPGMMLQAARWMLRPDFPLYVSPQFNLGYAAFMGRMLQACTKAQFARGSAALADLSGGALAAFDELRDDGVEFDIHDAPLTMLFTDPHKIDARENELALLDGKLPGFSWRRVDPNEVSSPGGTVPALADGVVGAIESRGDRSCDPETLVRGLAAACERDGVQLRLGEAAWLEDNGGHGTAGRGSAGRGSSGTGAGSAGAGTRLSVVTGRERMTPDHVVVAAGVWTNEVLAPIGETVPLQAGKGYGYDFPTANNGEGPQIPGPDAPIYLAEAKVAITPMNSKIRAAGTMGFGGINETVDHVRAGGIVTGMRRYFAEWPDRTRPVEPWTGLRPMTPDGVPHIGPLRRHPHVHVATGHAMLGIGLAPITGRLVVDFVAGRARPEQYPALQPGRFR